MKLKNLKKGTLLVALLLAVQALLLPAQTVYAFDAEQKEAFDLHVLYFNTTDDQFCAQPGSGGEANINVDKNFSLGKDAQQRRVNLVKALMNDYKLTAQQASGIVGNFMQESGGEHLPPDVNQGDTEGAPPRFVGGGYGWAQWTGGRIVLDRNSGNWVGIGGRQGSFIAFAINNGYIARGQRATDAADYAWLKQELNTSYKSTITALKKTSTPTAAAVSFHATFEKSADDASQIGERGTSAEKVYREVTGGGSSGGSSGGSGSSSGACEGDGSGAAIVGNYAFPLITTKASIDRQNPGTFKNGTVSKGGHPYTAFDIMINVDTQVIAFLSGKVTTVTTDRCSTSMVSVYNKESNLTVSYLHMKSNLSVKNGDTLKLGQKIGTIAPGPCGTPPHLHIDAAKGSSRPGCSRLDCPPANASQFVDIGPQLFKTYEELGNTKAEESL